MISKGTRARQPVPVSPEALAYLVLPLAPGLHRLYWSCGDWPGIIASDAETSNSPEALQTVAAHGLPDTRRAQPSKDLHCWKIAPLLEP